MMHERFGDHNVRNALLRYVTFACVLILGITMFVVVCSKRLGIMWSDIVEKIVNAL